MNFQFRKICPRGYTKMAPEMSAPGSKSFKNILPGRKFWDCPAIQRNNIGRYTWIAIRNNIVTNMSFEIMYYHRGH